MDYLYDYGIDTFDIAEIKENISDETYSDLLFFKKFVIENLNYLKEFGVTNYSKVFVKYPEIFLRDTESFKNVFSKFDKDDLIQKVAKNAAVFKKMVDFVDNN